MRGLGIDPERSGTAVPVTRNSTIWGWALPWAVGIWAPALFAAMGLSGEADPTVAAAVAGSMLAGIVAVSGVAPRWILQHLHRALTVPELDSLLEGSTDETERAFLSLLRDVLFQEVPANSAGRVYSALFSLGEAIARLPALRPERIDTNALRVQAAELLRLAAAEPDRVTAESLERQARAVQHRADANDQSNLTVRRADALRAEIGAQIAALREGLVALEVREADADALAELAAAAGTVATEAVRISAARGELDAAVQGVRADPTLSGVPLRRG
jgi:hypothetical protein